MEANQASRTAHVPIGQLQEDGFFVASDVCTLRECNELLECLTESVATSAGTRRLLEHTWCRDAAGLLRQRLAAQLPDIATLVAVQCTYFQKSTTTNWLVPWHQDRSIPVAARVNAAGLAGWSQKEGAPFVYGPDEVLAEMLAVRLHLDDSTRDNGPLRVIAGTHRAGTLSQEEIQRLREVGSETSCIIGKGGVLVMRPLLLHASSKAISDSPRRVLQFLFGPPKLPLGLAWGLTG